MSPIFAPRSGTTKLAVVKGSKLADLIGPAKLEDVGRYNWGTSDEAAINRALIELVGCQKVDADPLQSELDPTLGGEIYLPKPWTPEDSPIDFGKTHTIQLKKLLPMPAVAITELTPWFTPGDGTTAPCMLKYRLEGLDVRADKTDVEVHVARYLDRQGVSQSSYYMLKKAPRGGETTVVSDDNPEEESEVPCGTDGDADTYIWREHKDDVAPSPSVTVTWDGESKAEKGVLHPTGGKAYINSSCAPYSVLIRYYKSKDDEKAAIMFKESLFPRWTVGAGGTRTLDPASTVVKWTVQHGTKQKLTHGQLLVFDKKNAIVCRVVLDASKLSTGQLDVGPLCSPPIDRASMPYRVQIQAHSGPDEPEGLALAVMPTQVRAYDYQEVQLIAFNVKPPASYAGDAIHKTDIAVRCNAMIEAMRKAKGKSNTADDILKIFMAPEFYFRGPEGGYPVEWIQSIVPQLRKESDKIEYKDWMFVFGTAIGYEKREGTSSTTAIMHKCPVHEFVFSDAAPTEVTITPKSGTHAIIPEVGWTLVQTAQRAKITAVTEVVKYQKYKVGFAVGAFLAGDGTIEVPTMEVLQIEPATAAVKKLRVKGRIFERIWTVQLPGQKWKVHQNLLNAVVNRITRVGTTADEFTLELTGPFKAFVTGPIALEEPVSTEITNAALVQKGYPSPHMGDRSLSHAAIYKEYISNLDFERDKTLDWDQAPKRKIKIHGTPGFDRVVIPTSGAAEIGGGVHSNVRPDPTKTAGSEINKTGIGGGVVYSMHDITFGLEVCLDHGKSRLHKFYNGGTAVPGDPDVQILLIPSWGMTIAGGLIHCSSATSPIFNVDGEHGKSVARLNDGSPRCDDHVSKTGLLGSACNEPIRYYVCPTCNAKSASPGNCLEHTGVALEAYVTCGAPRKTCNSGCNVDVRCVHPKTIDIRQCESCNVSHRVGAACGCSTPRPQPTEELCGQAYREASGPCPDCGGTAIQKCPRPLAAIGIPMTVSGTPERVTGARAPHFDVTGSNGIAHVLAYNPVPIPLPTIR